MNAVDEGSTGLGAIVTPDLLHQLVPKEQGTSSSSTWRMARWASTPDL